MAELQRCISFIFVICPFLTTSMMLKTLAKIVSNKVPVKLKTTYIQYYFLEQNKLTKLQFWS